jgi:hypothetical protein
MGCSCLCPAGLYIPARLVTSSLSSLPVRVQVPVDRLSTLVEKPARAGQEPDASPRDTLTRATLPAAAAAASPPALQVRAMIPHGSLDTPVMLRPSPHSFLPSGWSGECIAASAARRPGDHSACQIAAAEIRGRG